MARNSKITASVACAIALIGCAGQEPPAANGAAADSETTTPKLLLIGIDGVRPDVLARVATPNIDELIARGAFSDQAQTGDPTVSGPSWSSMLTGVWSDKHGVRDNTFEGQRFENYPDFLTRVETVTPERETFAVADWVPLVSEGAISAAVDEVVSLDGYVFGWAEADSMAVDMAIDRLARQDLDAVFVYLGDPDETSHHHQSIGEEYERAIARADGHVGVLVSALKRRATYADEDWLILISTDHGRLEDGDHGGESTEERTIFFLAAGPGVSPGILPGIPQIVDVAVTALTHLGIPINPEWQLDGKAIGLR